MTAATGERGVAAPLRIGIDVGGTKIAGVVLAQDGRVVAEHRRPAPRGDYAASLDAIADVVALLEHSAGGGASVGLGIPGSLSPTTALVQNANSTWLNGRPFGRDLEAALRRPVRIANDANCFALSEARDGAGAGAHTVFGVILGTGCGGGLVIDGVLHDGPRGIAGEWGHNPLPWARADEHPGPPCWCGRMGCMETWVSGPALAADHQRVTAERRDVEAIAGAAAAGSGGARATLERHASRLARGLAGIINVLDPSLIVLGGGLSNLQHLYAALPALVAPYVLGEPAEVVIRPPRWGDASGVRGAAWLWAG
jgi:fructokinase